MSDIKVHQRVIFTPKHLYTYPTTAKFSIMLYFSRVSKLITHLIKDIFIFLEAAGMTSFNFFPVTLRHPRSCAFFSSQHKKKSSLSNDNQDAPIWKCIYAKSICAMKSYLKIQQ